MTVSRRTLRRHLWAVRDREAVHVLRIRPKLRDGMNPVLEVSSGRRVSFRRRDLYASRDEAEREIAMRILSG